MSSSPNQWYVQTDFGALLGPMPADALSELARTGALLRRDIVREGTDGTWRLASDWPNLFEEAAQKPRQPDTLQEPASPRASFKITSSARLLDDLMKSEKDKDSPRLVKTAKKLTAELDFEVDVPLLAPATVAKPPAVTERRAAEEFKTHPTPVVAPQLQLTKVAAPVPPPEPVPAAELTPPTDRTTGWEPLVPIRRFPTAHAFSPKRSLWKRLLPVAVATAVVLVTVWSIWPRQRPDIYSRYVAIYKELQERRDKAQDQTGWNEFTKRANTQLEEVLPWLEDNAKSGDREKSLLLYAGRDLQELLDQPRDSQAIASHQKRLNVFFEQLHEMYGSN